jgi:ferrochelatase
VKVIERSGRRVILPLSLYPHFSSSTTGSNEFYLKRQVMADLPQATFLQAGAYYLHEGYIQAWVDRIHETLKPGESLDDFHILFSAHGTPMYLVNEGDPYVGQVAQTVQAIVGSLQRRQGWDLSYQSAVGPIKWIRPSTDEMLARLSKRGVKNVIVVPVSFVNDHIETLCEIDIEYRDMAMKLGFQDFRMVKGIECHAGFIRALADCVEAARVDDRSKALKDR